MNMCQLKCVVVLLALGTSLSAQTPLRVAELGDCLLSDGGLSASAGSPSRTTSGVRPTTIHMTMRDLRTKTEWPSAHIA